MHEFGYKDFQRINKINVEKNIEVNIVNYAKKHDLFCIKLTSPSRIGMPDRMFISKDGEVFFIEFKSKVKNQLNYKNIL